MNTTRLKNYYRICLYIALAAAGAATAGWHAIGHPQPDWFQFVNAGLMFLAGGTALTHFTPTLDESDE